MLTRVVELVWFMVLVGGVVECMGAGLFRQLIGLAFGARGSWLST